MNRTLINSELIEREAPTREGSLSTALRVNKNIHNFEDVDQILRFTNSGENVIIYCNNFQYFAF